jgi:hypothetical protein
MSLLNDARTPAKERARQRQWNNAYRSRHQGGKQLQAAAHVA